MTYMVTVYKYKRYGKYYAPIARHQKKVKSEWERQQGYNRITYWIIGSMMAVLTVLAFVAWWLEVFI